MALHPCKNQYFPLMGIQFPLMGIEFPLMGNHFPLMGNKKEFPLMGIDFPLMGNQFPFMGNQLPLMGNQFPLMGNTDFLQGWSAIHFSNLRQIIPKEMVIKFGRSIIKNEMLYHVFCIDFFSIFVKINGPLILSQIISE